MEVLEIIWIDSCASNHNWLLIEDINIDIRYGERVCLTVKYLYLWYKGARR